ncbi:MAG: MFS transporter [Dysgonamonadaceae bacterium]|jgi:OPA family glycerol-3-phosphate transporter-like MFS transporter/OPA family sugar phosphate sensor protein UhpC-like MFS transporter|nr:MFS transporter [Dysgonamonadaceae bacterium]
MKAGKINAGGVSMQEMTGEERKKFKYWQWRTIIGTMIGYSLFYFVRKNLSVATPFMLEEGLFDKEQIGFIVMLHGLVYGISKFANGIIGDRVNSRIFMVAGLVLAALCNVLFGFSASLLMFGVFWLCNGWVQGMGFPPCARLITHWVRPDELATKMSVWNSSHSVGAGLVLVFCGYIPGLVTMLTGWFPGVETLGWRWYFYLPAAVSLLGAVFLWFTLRDTPSSVGLPEIAGRAAKTEETVEFRQFVRKRVFQNPTIWMLGFAAFFVYTIRFAVLDWGPTLLYEWAGIQIKSSVWMIAGFELVGIVGTLVAGWVADRFFGGRAVRVCVIGLALTVVSLLLFMYLPHSPLLMTVLLMAAGFFVYGPQALNGVIASNLVTNRASATAIGFTSLFAYSSTILSGWLMGRIADRYGWEPGLLLLVVAGILGVGVFASLWNIQVHGYEDQDTN